MTETQPAFPSGQQSDPDRSKPAGTDASDNSGGWDEARTVLRAKYPEANTDGVLFCIYKLQQDPLLSLRDFRDEAKMHGLSVAGRSLHSAKVALGLQAPARRRSRTPDGELSEADHAQAMQHWRRSDTDRNEERSRPIAAPTRQPTNDDGSLEHQMIAFAQQLQNRATEHGHKLRTAIQEAIRVLQSALDDTEPS